MKAALGALAEKYSEGLIDPEFGTKENAQIVEDVMGWPLRYRGFQLLRAV